jgi:hypothetical protein
MDDLTVARGYLDSATALARDAKDVRLEALLYGSTSWLHTAARLGEQRDRRTAVALLDSATGRARQIPPLERSYLYGSLAESHAALGDASRALSALDQAYAALAAAQHHSGAGFFSARGQLANWRYRLRRIDGVTHILLGRAREGLAVLEAALPAVRSLPNRARLLADIMRGHVAVADPDTACTDAMAALDAARSCGYVLGVLLVQETRDAFPSSWDDLPCVRELDAYLSTAR